MAELNDGRKSYSTDLREPLIIAVHGGNLVFRSMKTECLFSIFGLLEVPFTELWLKGAGQEGGMTRSRQSKGERAIWQRRFYEHTCRDEKDLKHCVDYIHVNPLKHKLVEKVKDWSWSSFHRYVRQGEYPRNWGNANEWYGDEFLNME